MKLDYFLLHGYIMWLSWTIFSIIMIATGRYCKALLWKSRIYIHLFLGLIIMILSFLFCNILPRYKHDSNSENHTFPGGAVLYIVIPVSLLGFVGRIVLNKCKWSTRLGIRLRRAHIIVSYIIIIIGNIAIVTGIYSYRVSI